jgi:hypothetical protein
LVKVPFDFTFREKNLRIKPQTSIRSSIARSLKIFPKGQWDKDLHPIVEEVTVINGIKPVRKWFVKLISKGIQNCKTKYHFYVIKEK